MMAVVRIAQALHCTNRICRRRLESAQASVVEKCS